MKERQEFLQEIEKLLSYNSFSRSDDIFIAKVVNKQPDTMISINGRPYKQNSGNEITLEYKIEALGTGTCESQNKVETFEQFRFELIQIIDGTKITIQTEDTCIEYNNIEYFKKEFNRIFNGTV